MSFYISAVGLLVAGLIIFLVRRDHLHTHYSFWWLFIAVVTAVLGIHPEINDQIAIKMGIFYPPILPVIIATLLLFLRVLIMDIENSKKDIKINRLIQRLAILEEQIGRQHDSCE